MYELKKRHWLIITGAAPQETELGKTNIGFTRAELQFMIQVCHSFSVCIGVSPLQPSPSHPPSFFSLLKVLLLSLIPLLLTLIILPHPSLSPSLPSSLPHPVSVYVCTCTCTYYEKGMWCQVIFFFWRYMYMYFFRIQYTCYVRTQFHVHLYVYLYMYNCTKAYTLHQERMSCPKRSV